MEETNLEKFLPALIGMIGRVAGAAGGGDEEEEKSMDKQQIEKDWNPFKKKNEEPKSTPPDVKINPGERIGGPGDRIQVPMKKQHVEQALLKLMKHYPGDEGYDTGHEQHQKERWDYIRGTDPPEDYNPDEGPAGFGSEIDAQQQAFHAAPKGTVYSSRGGQYGEADYDGPIVKKSVMKSLQKLMKGGSFYGGAREPKGGVAQGKLPAGEKPWGQEENKAKQDAAQEKKIQELMERFGSQQEKKTNKPFLSSEQLYVKPKGKEAMEKGDRDMPIQEHSDIKFRPGPQTHPEHTRIPTPEDPRTFSPSMGDLEDRLSSATETDPDIMQREEEETVNRRTRGGRKSGAFGVRMRQPYVDDYRPGRTHMSGGAPEARKIPIGKALLKLTEMVEEGFISKKADPAMAAQSRAASRQRGAATQERIAGQAASGAQQVQGPVDNTAQQIGSEVAGALGWQIGQTLDEKNRPPPGQGGRSQYDTGGDDDDDMPNVSSVEGLKNFVAEEGKAAGAQQDANTPGTSGLYGPTGAPLPASSTAPPTQDMTTTPKADPNKLNLPATGMMGPTTKPTAGNMPDLTNKPWKPANSA